MLAMNMLNIVDMSSFGRRLITNAKQGLNQRIKEIEKEVIYKEYQGLSTRSSLARSIRSGKMKFSSIITRMSCFFQERTNPQRNGIAKGERFALSLKKSGKASVIRRLLYHRADPAFLGNCLSLKFLNLRWNHRN